MKKKKEIVGKKELVLLAVGLAESYLSPTQLQKAVFLLQYRLDPNIIKDGFYFSPQGYGPSSNEIYEVASSLAETKLLYLITVASESYSSYLVSPTGVLATEKLLKSIGKKNKKYAKSLIAWVESQEFRQLVSAILYEYPEYAVNTIFRSALHDKSSK